MLLPITTAEKYSTDCIKWERPVNTKWVKPLLLCVEVSKKVKILICYIVYVLKITSTKYKKMMVSQETR